MLLHNENKLDEMCEIMEELQKYVPSCTCQVKHPLPNGDSYIVEEQAVHQILSGGDQLTCCRCRGAQSLRCNHESTLKGLFQLQKIGMPGLL